MKIRISKLAIILTVLVLLGPVFDLLTGYDLSTSNLDKARGFDSITPGVLYRGVFLIPIFILLSHFLKNSARFVIYYFGIAFLLGVILRGLDNNEIEIFRNAQRYLKLMLPIIGFTGMLFIGQYFADNKPLKIFWKTATLYGAITAFGLLSTDFLGLSLFVYRGSTAASAGLIDSQNAAGLILIVSLPIALYYVYKYRNNGTFSVLLVEGLWLTAAFRLNTRAALVAVPGLIIFHHAILFAKGEYTKTALRTIGMIALLGFTAIIGFFIIQAWLQRDVGYILDRFALLAEGQFRQRVPYGIATITQFNIQDHLFGLGDTHFQTTENDFVDVYGKFGLTTLLPIFMFYGYFFIRLLVNFLRFRTYALFMLFLSVSLYIIHGITAGHALLSSPINNLFFFIYFLSYLEMKQYERPKEPLFRPDQPPFEAPAVPPPLAYDT